MNEAQYLEMTLVPVTTFLTAALEEMGGSEELERTAAPLIHALEAVPGAGRAAVFLDPGDDSPPRFIAGPSFSASEVDAVCRLMRGYNGGLVGPGPFEAELAEAGGAPNFIRLFSLKVPDEVPGAIIVTVRDQPDDQQHTVLDAFMDQIARLAGVVVEDRRLRSRLLDQQSMLQGLIDAAPDAIIRMDCDGRIQDFLGQAAGMFGWTVDEIVEQHVSMLMPDPHARRHDDYVRAYLETGERKLLNFGRRLQALHKSGKTFPVEIALSELRVGGEVAFIGIIRDISLRVAREQEVDALREAIDAASRQSALGELAATIAHELNQPLTAIANYMDALELRLSTPGADHLDTALDIIRKTAAQARLGGEIIRRTRRMALKGETEPAPAVFADTVAEAVALISKTPRSAGVTIAVEHAGDREPVLFDRIQVQQVVINLASNAIRALQGCERAVLSVLTRQDQDKLELVVRDTGPGIPDEDKARIFDRFFRRSDNGMGLGLAIVRRIATAHGGEVVVRDAPGGGAEFALTLPRRSG